jgi:hypothetical protein
MSIQNLENKQFRQVLDELVEKVNSKCKVNTDNVEEKIKMDFGDLTINGITYSVTYSYKKNHFSKECSFNEQLYKHTSKILTASMISMYFGKVDVNSVTLSLLGYLFGESIFPILVTNYSLSYVYRYLT